VARANARRLGADHRVHFAEGTATAGVGRFDLLVANLPYVSAEEWESVQPEIREYEPRGALVPGPTGLEAIEAVLGEVSVLERPPSAVALEVGAGQSGLVAELVRRAGYDSVESRRDLAGVERVVLGR
jgi:release factor glutamine methyltransferase